MAASVTAQDPYPPLEQPAPGGANVRRFAKPLRSAPATVETSVLLSCLSLCGLGVGGSCGRYECYALWQISFLVHDVTSQYRTRLPSTRRDKLVIGINTTN